MSELPILDTNVMIELFGVENHELFCKVLLAYTQKEVADTNALAEAVANGCNEDARKLAHKLKSSARAIGALHLGDLYFQIEREKLDLNMTTSQTVMAEFNRVIAQIEAYCAKHA